MGPPWRLMLQCFCLQPHKGQGSKGPSARQRHRAGREAGPGESHRVSAKAAGNGQARGKLERQLAAKQLRCSNVAPLWFLLEIPKHLTSPCFCFMGRDAKRRELLDLKRLQGGSPLVVAVLPLSKVNQAMPLAHVTITARGQ